MKYTQKLAGESNGEGTPVTGMRPEAVSSNALFADWWNETGSGLPPLPNEDASEHVERVSRLAFEVGANPWRMNAGKWWCQYCLSVIEPECVTFEECHDPRSGGCGGPVQVIPANVKLNRY